MLCLASVRIGPRIWIFGGKTFLGQKTEGSAIERFDIWENDSSKLNFIFVSCPKITSMLVTDLIEKNIVDQSRTRNGHEKNVGQKIVTNKNPKSMEFKILSETKTFPVSWMPADVSGAAAILLPSSFTEPRPIDHQSVRRPPPTTIKQRGAKTRAQRMKQAKLRNKEKRRKKVN